MKCKFKFLLSMSVAALSVTAATSANAESATADAKSDIVSSSSVTRLADLQFGDIIAGSTPSTVIVEPILQSRNVDTGDAIAFGGTVSAAAFRVEARPLLFYEITLPTSTTITQVDGTETMLVDNYTLDGLPIRLLPLFTTIGNFKVGGRLNVKANQADGDYKGSFTVNVEYF